MQAARVMRRMMSKVSPDVGHHVGVITSPGLGKAKIAQLDHGRLTVVQQCVVQLQVSAGAAS